MLLYEMPEQWQMMSLRALEIAIGHFGDSPVEIAKEGGPLDELYGLWEEAHASEEEIWGALFYEREKGSRSARSKAAVGNVRPYKDLARFNARYKGEMDDKFEAKDGSFRTASDLIAGLHYPGAIICPEEYGGVVIMMVEGAIYKKSLRSAFEEAGLLKGTQLCKENCFPTFLVGDDFDRWLKGECENSVFRKKDKDYAQFIALFSRICGAPTNENGAYDDVNGNSYAVLRNRIMGTFDDDSLDEAVKAVDCVAGDLLFSGKYAEKKGETSDIGGNNDRIRKYIRRTAFTNSNKRCGLSGIKDGVEINGYLERYTYFTLSEIILMKPEILVFAGINSEAYEKMNVWREDGTLTQTRCTGERLIPDHVCAFLSDIKLIRVMHPSFRKPRAYLLRLLNDLAQPK